MRYDTPEAFRAALDQRIRNEAQSNGVPVMRLRKRVAFERLLARIAATDSHGVILKGAFALELRLGLHTRTTRDIDLGGAEDEQSAHAVLLAAQHVDLHDHFEFKITRSSALDQAEAFRAVRYGITAELAGRVFERFPLDLALGDEAAHAEAIWLPSLLDFADIEPARMPVIAIEAHAAEKLHAYTATYGPNGQRSTRVKDLIDVLLIAKLATPDSTRLRASLEETFSKRARQPLPVVVPEPPATWSRAYARMARELSLPDELRTAHSRAASFFNPVLDGTATGCWQPRQRRWFADRV